MTSFWIESRRSAEAVHLHLGGELDLTGVSTLEQELADGRQPQATLVLDLREIEFIDSSGLRALLVADRDARRQGRRCVVVRGPESVDRVFRLTGVGERLEIVDDPDQI